MPFPVQAIQARSRIEALACAAKRHWHGIYDARSAVSRSQIKREVKRRAAIEPVIGYLKEFHRIGRNYVAHASRDAIDAGAKHRQSDASINELCRMTDWLCSVPVRDFV
jgi:hypothetical protein